MFYRPACHCNTTQSNIIAVSLLEPSLRLSCVYIFIPWPSLGDLAPPVSSRCPTWRSREADLSQFLSLFSWFQQRFFRKVRVFVGVCMFLFWWGFSCVSVPNAEIALPQQKPEEYREKLWCVCALDAHKLPLQISASLSISPIVPSTPNYSRRFSRLLGCLSCGLILALIKRGAVLSFSLQHSYR